MLYTIARKVSGFLILVGLAGYFSAMLTAGGDAMSGHPETGPMLAPVVQWSFLLAAGGAVVYGGLGLLRTFVGWVREQRAERSVAADQGSAALAVILIGGMVSVLAVCVLVGIASTPVNADEIQGCATALQDNELAPNGVPLVDRLPECSLLSVDDQATAITWSEPSEG